MAYLLFGCKTCVIKHAFSIWTNSGLRVSTLLNGICKFMYDRRKHINTSMYITHITYTASITSIDKGACIAGQFVCVYGNICKYLCISVCYISIHECMLHCVHTHFQVCHDSFVRVMWRICVCVLTYVHALLYSLICASCVVWAASLCCRMYTTMFNSILYVYNRSSVYVNTSR